MRKIILLIIFLWIWINYWNAAIVEQLTNKISDSNCIGALVNKTYYISWSTTQKYLIDEIWWPTDRYIALSTSKISFWESSANLFSGCRTTTDWVRQSEIFPWNNTKVVAYWANCTFNKPTDKNKRNIQFVYNISHWNITTEWTTTFIKNYTTYNHSTSVWNSYTKSYPKYYVKDYITHPNECFNVELRYCWDWILETSNWEVCDDGNNLNWDWCSATCTIDVPQSCVAWVTWAQTAPISSSTPNLCAISWETVVNFTSSVTWNTTNYVWNCKSWTVIKTWWNCNASYKSWGWGWGSCLNWPVTWQQTSPVYATTPWLCKIWLLVEHFTQAVVWNTTNYSRSCGWYSWWNCNASYTSWGWGWGWGGGWGGGWGWWHNFCWDGIVQRPNDDLEMEECDLWNEIDRKYCIKETCKYKAGTRPDETPIKLWPDDNVIIWKWMNPYSSHWLWRPYIMNLSDYDLYFDQICVVSQWSTLVWDTVCSNLWIIRGHTTVYYPVIPNFEWGNIPSSNNYGDNTLITTIKHDWIRYDDAYFGWKLKVRVAKSSVATTWWWTSYVSNTDSVWNISKVANNWNISLKPEDNKNFVWVGVSKWDVSSYTNDVSDSGSISVINKIKDKYSQGIDNVSNTEWTTIGETSLLSDFKNYNWINNVFILTNKSFKVESGTFNSVSWARTYIIENGNLIINSNINFSDNIAFVIKWWNIQIDKSVTKINWTYITIEKNWVWWKFEWKWWNTIEQLNIYGSLYWNINDLISSRTYVKQNSANQIDVWTIVSFGSSLFRKTAPLIWTFINEYLQSEKISK